MAIRCENHLSGKNHCGDLDCYFCERYGSMTPTDRREIEYDEEEAAYAYQKELVRKEQLRSEYKEHFYFCAIAAAQEGAEMMAEAEKLRLEREAEASRHEEAILNAKRESEEALLNANREIADETDPNWFIRVNGIFSIRLWF